MQSTLFHTLKIGSLTLNTNIFVAPLAGYTNLPTRLVYRTGGAIVAYTEMVSALGLHYNYTKSAGLLKSATNDKPLGIQLFGPDATSILQAFLKIKHENFDIVDINCGCSVRKILKGKAGAYLLQDPDEIHNIIKLLKQNTDKPVTLKIRSGWDKQSINYLDVLAAAENAGADLITFHPRTRAMLFSGKAQWEQITDLKQKASIPVIGNGDIFTADDAVNMMRQTGCDGVMLARGVIENPFLVSEVLARFKGETYTPPDLAARFDQMIKHCAMFVEYCGEREGMILFRKFIRGYIKGLPSVSRLRQELNNLHSYSLFEKKIVEYTNFLQKNNFPAAPC